MEPKLIVHGGAWNIPEKLHEAHINGCQKTVEQVYPELKNGLSALDAVEQSVNILEKDPTFDAGRGAFLNANGKIELDAIICDGKTLAFGAIAAITNILHPVSAARLIMEKTEHCMLVGEGADQFLSELNFPKVSIEALLTERELEYYRRIKSDPNFKTRKPFESSPHDTVGAVAMDQNGNFAAATSTGGTPRKLPGRVGDSPLIGAGAYADNQSGAVSATGWGESIMKVLLARSVCNYFKHHSAQKAAESGITDLQDRVNGLGGVIGINREGEYACFHNTEYMAFAFYTSGTGISAGIENAR